MDEKIFLSDISVGESCIVKFVQAEGQIKRRLFDMGVTPGASITVIKKAPLGDPIQVFIRNYDLSLRNAEASCIVVERIEVYK